MPVVDVRDFAVVSPLVALAVSALVALLIDLMAPNGKRHPWGFVVGLVGLGVAAYQTVRLWATLEGGAITAFHGALVADHFVLLFHAILIGTAAFATLMLWERLPAESGGIMALVLWATMGMMVLTGSGNLMAAFMGLELLSLALYVLVSHRVTVPAGNEAALKYLILGSTASAFFVFGAALMFGATGALDWAGLKEGIATGGMGTMAVVGSVFVLIGLAFKLGLVPFHNWVPDVYEGAPTPITAYMSVGSKAAAFAVLSRVFSAVLGPDAPATAILWILAIASMLVGNFGALPQTNLKRLLGYSGIAHAGYLIAALPGLTDAGVRSAVFYLVAYGLMNIGAFAVMAWLDATGENGEDLSGYQGLFSRRPVLAAAMALFMFALAGLPPTAGFTGKWLILSAALSGGGWVLGAFLIGTTIVSLYVYLKVVVAMFMPVEAGEASGLGVTDASREVAASGEAGIRGGSIVVLALTVFVAAWGLVQFGLAPGSLETLIGQLTLLP